MSATRKPLNFLIDFRNLKKRVRILEAQAVLVPTSITTFNGVPDDTIFDEPPPDGTMVLDTASDFLYVRTNGVWKRTNLT